MSPLAVAGLVYLWGAVISMLVAVLIRVISWAIGRGGREPAPEI
jgi:hypothetical protein